MDTGLNAPVDGFCTPRARPPSPKTISRIHQQRRSADRQNLQSQNLQLKQIAAPC